MPVPEGPVHCVGFKKIMNVPSIFLKPFSSGVKPFTTKEEDLTSDSNIQTKSVSNALDNTIQAVGLCPYACDGNKTRVRKQKRKSSRQSSSPSNRIILLLCIVLVGWPSFAFAAEPFGTGTGFDWIGFVRACIEQAMAFINYGVPFMDTGQTRRSVTDHIAVSGYGEYGEWEYRHGHGINNNAHENHDGEDEIRQPQDSRNNGVEIAPTVHQLVVSGQTISSHDRQPIDAHLENQNITDRVMRDSKYTDHQGTGLINEPISRVGRYGTRGSQTVQERGVTNHQLLISEHCTSSQRHTWINELEPNENITCPIAEVGSDVSRTDSSKLVITGRHHSEDCPAVYPPSIDTDDQTPASWDGVGGHQSHGAVRQEMTRNEVQIGGQHATCASGQPTDTVDRQHAPQTGARYATCVSGSLTSQPARQPSRCSDNTHHRRLITGQLISQDHHADTLIQWRNDNIQEPTEEHLPDSSSQLPINGHAFSTSDREYQDTNVVENQAHPTDELGDSPTEQRGVLAVSVHNRHQPLLHIGNHHQLAVTQLNTRPHNVRPAPDHRRPVVNAGEIAVTGQRHIPWALMPPPVHSSGDINSTPRQNVTGSQEDDVSSE